MHKRITNTVLGYYVVKEHLINNSSGFERTKIYLT